MGFLLAKAVIDGTERLSVIAESALPHLPQWTAVDPGDVRANPSDFEEPEPDADGPADAATSEPADAQPPTDDGPPAAEPPTPRRKPAGAKSADTEKE